MIFGLMTINCKVYVLRGPKFQKGGTYFLGNLALGGQITWDAGPLAYTNRVPGKASYSDVEYSCQWINKQT